MAMIHPPGGGRRKSLLGSSVSYCQAGIFCIPFHLIPFVPLCHPERSEGSRERKEMNKKNYKQIKTIGK